MQLDTRGHPIHTRTHSVTLSQASSGSDEIEFTAYVLDLRKRGFVPVAGDIQGTGIIHHMQLRGRFKAADLRLVEIRAEMPTVAFEPSATSAGESCRDVAGAATALVGASLADGWARRLGDEIGGPRGCSHVLTLAHLVGPTAVWALARDRELHGHSAGGLAPRRPGERIFRRDVTVDGAELPDRRLGLTLQQADLAFRPAPALSAAMDRFAAQHEIRGQVSLRLDDLFSEQAVVAERRRRSGDMESAPWVDRSDRAAILRNRSMRAGVTAALTRAFFAAGDPGQDRPLLDALLTLAPTTIQCFASMIDTATQAYAPGSSPAEMGGLPDSCHMWRNGGPLTATRRTP